MYVVTVNNQSRSDLYLSGVPRFEGKIDARARETVNLSDAEYAVAKASLDSFVTRGLITYTVIREGFGMIQTRITFAEQVLEADGQQDFSLDQDLPSGAVPFAASLVLEETADGGAATALTCEILIGSTDLFSAPLDILDATATVGDNASADQNLVPLAADASPVLRVDITDANMDEITQGIVLCTILYYNPALMTG